MPNIELYQLVNGYVKELDIKPTGTMISSLVLAFIKGLRINDALNLLQVSKRQKLRLPVETGSQIIELIKEIIDDLNTKKMLDGSNSEFVCSVRNLIRDYYGINLIDRPYISGQQIDRNSHFDKDYKVLSNRYLTISESTSFQTLLSIPWLFTSIDDIEAIWYFCDNNNNNKSQNLLKSIESQLTYLKAIDRVLEAHNGNSDITNTKADQKRVWRLLVNYRLYYIKNNKPKKSNHNIGTSTRMVIKSDILLTMMKIATKTVSTDDSYMLVDWLIDYSTDNLKQQKTSYPSNGYKDATTNLEMMKNYIDALRYVIDRLESDYWKLRIEKDNSRLLIVNSRGLDKVKTVTKNGIATRKRKRSRLNQNALIGGKQLIIENGVNQLWYHYNKYWATSSLDCIENANSGSIDQVILDMKLNLGRIFVSCFGDTEKCFKILDDLSTSAPRKASNDNSKMMDLGLQISECFVGYPRLYLEYIERSKPKLLTMMDHIDSNSIGIGLIDIISTWKQWNEYKYQIFGHLLSSSFKDISWDKVESALVIMICRILKHSKTCRIGIPEYPIGIPSSLESHYHDVAINVFMKQIDTGMSLTEEIEVKTWAKHVCEALSKPDDLVLDTLNL
ncbi:hypothetical protein H4219_005700 [Mycoemilia scoparia]|uniref:Uncharacterized protein n=1 Tax=Mycoemilia scoparia TaxID=417184 RepID=A0A9W7ZNC9_9FUNG|nr:hypothetical protein H4219_005700 [Mycoemilia scoparia]